MNISSTALLMLNRAVEQLDDAASGIRQATNPVPQQDRVDLSTEAVKLLSARSTFHAGIALAKTADEINEQTLDLLA